MNKDLNLGMVIGIFFSVAGSLLTWYGMMHTTDSGNEINIGCGICYIIFGAVMLISSYFSEIKKKGGVK